MIKEGYVLRATKDYNFDDGHFVVKKGEEFEIYKDEIGQFYIINKEIQHYITYLHFGGFIWSPLFRKRYIPDGVFESVAVSNESA